jgi:RNA polymerase sigma-70 factor, ECF subfamily
MENGDAAAVALARTGDSDAFRLLVERHGRRLFRLAFRLMANEEDAEDVVQETFLRAYRGLDRFDERAGVGTWLHRIATNCALDLLRVRKRRADPGPPSVPPGPEALVQGGELQARIGVALGSMTPAERVAFTLRHFEGGTTEEISEILGCSPNATKQAVFRAVQKLRQALEAPPRPGADSRPANTRVPAEGGPE